MDALTPEYVFEEECDFEVDSQDEFVPNDEPVAPLSEVDRQKEFEKITNCIAIHTHVPVSPAMDRHRLRTRCPHFCAASSWNAAELCWNSTCRCISPSQRTLELRVAWVLGKHILSIHCFQIGYPIQCLQTIAHNLQEAVMCFQILCQWQVSFMSPAMR